MKKNLDALKDLKKPDGIIFDWDNTLVDTWPIIARAINNTMRFMNREEWTLKQVKDNVHKSMRESFPVLFGDQWERAGEVYKKTYREVHLSELHTLPYARELLDCLQEKNILAFLVSNKIGTTLRKEVKNLQLQDKFFSVIGSLDASFDKPHADPVLLALSGSHLSINKCQHLWFIGDTIADVDCAYNIGCQPIIYGYENSVSKTITSEILANGKNNEGAIPLLFNHLDLINLIRSF